MRTVPLHVSPEARRLLKAFKENQSEKLGATITYSQAINLLMKSYNSLLLNTEAETRDCVAIGPTSEPSYYRQNVTR